MLSFCLFESHGRIVVLESLTTYEAKEIFKKYGAKDNDMESASAVSKFFKSKVKELHPDLERDPKIKIVKQEKFKELSSAKDVLVANPSANNTSNREEYQGTPPWQTDMRASYNSINRNNCTDMNYFMKSMWELSNHSREKWNVMAYDGAFFRSSITVFGSKDIFKDMAKGMIVWNSHGGNPYKTRAVFVSRERDSSNDIYLIYLDKKFYDKNPIKFEHDSFNKNVSNDQQFCRKLPVWLDEITADDE